MRTKHLCVLIHIRIKGQVGIMKLVEAFQYFFPTVSRQYFFYGFFILFYVCLFYIVLSVSCSLVVTRLLCSPVCDVFLHICHFPIQYPGSYIVI